MAQGMRKQYPGKPVKCRDFTDKTKVCMSSKGWSVFFGKVTKLAGKGGETKPRPKSVEETYQDEIIEWCLKNVKRMEH